MKISQLIARLEALRAEQGDIVVVTDSAAGPEAREVLLLPYEHNPENRKPAPFPDGTPTALIW